MSKNLSENQILEVKKSELKTRCLVTIYLEQPIRILENDTLNVLTIGGHDYVAGMVKRGNIETSTDGTVEKVNITISNVGQEISAIIANRGDVLTNKKCTIEEVIFSAETNEIIEEPILLFEGLINNIQLTAVAFSFDVERVLGGYSTVSPNSTYDVNCQYKFKDVRCGYTGTATSCDKTLSRCKALGNITQFGGFPSIVKEMVVKT